MLEGRVAVVTGGTKGIGKGIADELAAQGAKVVVCGRSEEETEHHFIKADVCNSSDCSNLIEESVKRFGKIDILVNNAGIYPFKSFEEMTKEDWDKVMEVNLGGMFNCIKSAYPHMKDQNYGRVINIASIAGYELGYEGLVHYCATKAGVAGFTKAAAVEFAKHGINVNAVAPGAIETPGTEDVLKGEMRQNMINSTPKGRIGRPEDIAGIVAYLASEKSDFMTGQTIVVDGGITIL